MIFDSIISVYRLAKDADNTSKESFVANLALGAVKCQLQPASAEQTMMADGIYGQTYLMFTTSSGLFTGDKITVSGTGEVMRIKGVKDWSWISGIPHYEMTVVRLEEEEVLV